MQKQNLYHFLRIQQFLENKQKLQKISYLHSTFQSSSDIDTIIFTFEFECHLYKIKIFTNKKDIDKLKLQSSIYIFSIYKVIEERDNFSVEQVINFLGDFLI